jgi:hypothetical protein
MNYRRYIFFIMSSLSQRIFFMLVCMQLLTALLTALVIGVTSGGVGLWFEVLRIGLAVVLLLPVGWWCCVHVARVVDRQIAAAVVRATCDLDGAVRLATQYVNLRADAGKKQVSGSSYVGNAAGQQHC